ncbi:enoyl-ACP reductase FabV [Parasphaerochaeta coccoides]|uniref:Trans-2-enoyl-CoA reductase [NADH] n=1 Tax=Parasphaerochaeta coccoides (strain ATCC BAA-1237 / DSM 17374 / SPN1) TaxID=760011 RepID=F4GJL3_PARC1|nr:enoyl-ACP reductase FabV [Parasphaerochaeta coccoides]AEC02760.1 reductase [Parasphaerochaeta coccoides DSM 17374]
MNENKVVIQKKVIRNISLTAHPAGCARYVRDLIEQARSLANGSSPDKRYLTVTGLSLPKRVLVIGGSTGYGLASRVVAAFCGGADTIGVSFERLPTESKTATPGWYATHVFDQEARKTGSGSVSLYGDAFAMETKEKVAQAIKETCEGGQVDMVVYSIASPVRTDPQTGVTYQSVLKTVGEPYESLSLDIPLEKIISVTVPVATGEQVAETVKVMGGEDWMLWMEYLKEQGVLASGVKTIAYSYIGPEKTYPIYRHGSIGMAKRNLEETVPRIDGLLASLDGKAYVSVNKALVTRASFVIPVVPLYMALLYQIMQEKNLHEGCLEQAYRLFTEKLYGVDAVATDEMGRIRLDDWEMRRDVQEDVDAAWLLQKDGEKIAGGNVISCVQEYDRLHGFGYEDIDYNLPIDPREIL